MSSKVDPLNPVQHCTGAPLPNGSSTLCVFFFLPLSFLFLFFLLSSSLSTVFLWRCCRETFVTAQRDFEVEHTNQKDEVSCLSFLPVFLSCRHLFHLSCRHRHRLARFARLARRPSPSSPRGQKNTLRVLYRGIRQTAELSVESLSGIPLRIL